MLVYFDKNTQAKLKSLGRQHPWTESSRDPGARFVDFKAEPHLIESTLSDFNRFRQFPAIPRFFDMMRWLNGPHSIFETNDCGLRPPKPTEGGPVPWMKLQIYGRLTVLYRDLGRNTIEKDFAALCSGVAEGLGTVDPGFNFGCYGWSGWPHLFITVGPLADGHVLHLDFWAWGDDDEGAFANLNRTFRNLETVLRELTQSLA
jgi:hypothetical protein